MTLKSLTLTAALLAGSAVVWLSPAAAAPLGAGAGSIPSVAQAQQDSMGLQVQRRGRGGFRGGRRGGGGGVGATSDLILYLVFMLPGVTALIWAGYIYAGESWAIWERSSITADGPPLYHFKTFIPIAGAFLLLQGFAEIIRCVRCLKDNKWPSREEDVEEVDVEKLKDMMHIKDEDIAKLDEFVTHEKGSGK